MKIVDNRKKNLMKILKILASVEDHGSVATFKTIASSLRLQTTDFARTNPVHIFTLVFE